jgi:hypothetical protein
MDLKVQGTFGGQFVNNLRQSSSRDRSGERRAVTMTQIDLAGEDRENAPFALYARLC